MNNLVNADIRSEMKTKNITIWKLADLVGVSEQTLIRWFRHELPEDKKQLLKAALNSFNG